MDNLLPPEVCSDGLVTALCDGRHISCSAAMSMIGQLTPLILFARPSCTEGGTDASHAIFAFAKRNSLEAFCHRMVRYSLPAQRTRCAQLLTANRAPLCFLPLSSTRADTIR